MFHLTKGILKNRKINGASLGNEIFFQLYFLLLIHVFQHCESNRNLELSESSLASDSPNLPQDLKLKPSFFSSFLS